MLNSDDIELLCTSLPDGMSDYDSIEFVREDIIAVLPKNHPLAQESLIPLASLKNVL